MRKLGVLKSVFYLAALFLFSCGDTDSNRNNKNLNKVQKKEITDKLQDSFVAPTPTLKVIVQKHKLIFNSSKTDSVAVPLFVPDNIIAQLDLITVTYLNFNRELATGVLLVNSKVSAEVKSIFNELLAKKFLICKVSAGLEFNLNDSLMMANNLTSCFNYRVVANTSKLSQHAYGMAIDINPVQNPYIEPSGKSYPLNSSYTIGAPGTVSAKGVCREIFKSHNWKWGGAWRSAKDYQHFSKTGH